MKPNIANRLRDEAVTQELQTIERRSTSSAWPSRTSPAAAAISSWCSCRASTDVRVRRRSSGRRRCSSLKLVDQGPFARGRRAAGVQQQPAERSRDASRQAEGCHDRRGSGVFYAVEEVGRSYGSDLRSAQHVAGQYSRPAVRSR
jgi:hypothetical protein